MSVTDATFNLNRGSNYYYSYSNIQYGGRFVLDKTTLNNDGAAYITVKSGASLEFSEVVSKATMSFITFEGGSTVSITDSVFSGELVCNVAGTIDGGQFTTLSLGTLNTTVDGATA